MRNEQAEPGEDEPEDAKKPFKKAAPPFKKKGDDEPEDAGQGDEPDEDTPPDEEPDDPEPEAAAGGDQPDDDPDEEQEPDEEEGDGDKEPSPPKDEWADATAHLIDPASATDDEFATLTEAWK